MSEPIIPPETPVLPYRGALRRKRPSIWPIFLFVLILLAIPYILGYSMHFVVYNYLTEGQTSRLHAMAYNRFVASTMYRIYGSYIFEVLALSTVMGFLYAAKTPWRSRIALRRPESTMISIVVFIMGAIGFDVVAVSLEASLNLRSASLERIYDLLRHARTEAPISAFLLVVVIGPILEEMIFRGFIQTRLVRRLGPIWGILITSILFGIFHRDIIQGTVAAISGVYLGVVSYRTGSILPSILCHSAINGTSTLVIYWGIGPILIDHMVVLAGWVVVIASCYLLLKTTAPFSEYRICLPARFTAAND